QQWKQLFDKIDPEGFGEIPWQDFLDAIITPEFQTFIEPPKQAALVAKAFENGRTSITFEEFVNVVSAYNSTTCNCKSNFWNCHAIWHHLFSVHNQLSWIIHSNCSI
ncbi:rhomboid-related protein 3-like protein, partial [Leptotrombidium deliense]